MDKKATEWVERADEIEELIQDLESDPIRADMGRLLRQMRLHAVQGLLQRDRLRELEQCRARTIQAHRGPGNANERLAAAWKAGEMPPARKRRHPVLEVQDYVHLCRGNKLLGDELAEQAAGPDARHLRGTAAELTKKLRQLSVEERRNLRYVDIDDSPCTPEERCELIAAWRGRASGTSVASALRRERKEIERILGEAQDGGAEEAADELRDLLDHLSDVPHGRP